MTTKKPAAKKAVKKSPAKKGMSGAKKGAIVAGVLAGAALAAGAAYYLNTPDGRKMLKDFEKKAMVLQKKLLVELKKTKKMTKENYAELVDKLTSYYMKTKDIAASEAPEIKKYLMSKYHEIEKEYKKVK